MAVLNDVEQDQDHLNDKELEAFDKELVSPSDIVNSKDASHHAEQHDDQQAQETCKVEWRVELVLVFERCVEATCSAELGVEKTIDLKTENKSKEFNCSHVALVVSDPMAEGQVIHDLLLENDEEEEVD